MVKFKLYVVGTYVNFTIYYYLEDETDSCQKGCKRKSGAAEASVEPEENSEKKAKLDEAEEDPATAEPQFVEA